MPLRVSDLQALETGMKWVGILDAIRSQREEEQRKAEAIREQQEIKARQFQGIQGYQADIAAGVPQIEAVKRHGANLFAGRPADYVRAVQSLQPKPEKEKETWKDEPFEFNGVSAPSQVSSTGQRRLLPMPRVKSEPAPGSVEDVSVGGKSFAKVVNPNGNITLHPAQNELTYPVNIGENKTVQQPYRQATNTINFLPDEFRTNAINSKIMAASPPRSGSTEPRYNLQKPDAPKTSSADSTTKSYKKGDRAKQNGIVYVFDGENWNPAQ